MNDNHFCCSVERFLWMEIFLSITLNGLQSIFCAIGNEAWDKSSSILLVGIIHSWLNWLNQHQTLKIIRFCNFSRLHFISSDPCRTFRYLESKHWFLTLAIIFLTSLSPQFAIRRDARHPQKFNSHHLRATKVFFFSRGKEKALIYDEVLVYKS